MKHKNIGYHISISDTKKALDKLNEDKVGCCQIFISNNRSLQSCSWSEKKINEIKNGFESLNITPFIHGPYLINLSNRDKNVLKKNINVILNQLEISDLIKSKGVVIHMGKGVEKSKEEAIENYIKSVKEVLKLYNGKSKLILETAAGQGTEICKDLKDLHNMFNKFTEKEKSKLGICIDTCHVFSAGYKIDDIISAKIFYKEVIDLFGDYICLVHMNDSKVQLGSKKDRHEDIGYGYIGLDGLKKLYKLFSKNYIPIILETPSKNSDFIDQIKKLIE